MLKCRYCERIYQDESQFCGDCGNKFSLDDLNRYRRERSQKTYSENEIEEWEWGAAKQLRTCGLCLALDGKRFSVREKFESHEGCRCTLLPITRLSRERKNLGKDWFEKQSAKDQLGILGEEKFQLFKNGKSLVEIYGLVEIGRIEDERSNRK